MWHNAHTPSTENAVQLESEQFIFQLNILISFRQPVLQDHLLRILQARSHTDMQGMLQEVLL